MQGLNPHDILYGALKTQPIVSFKREQSLRWFDHLASNQEIINKTVDSNSFEWQAHDNLMALGEDITRLYDVEWSWSVDQDMKSRLGYQNFTLGRKMPDGYFKGSLCVAVPNAALSKVRTFSEEIPPSPIRVYGRGYAWIDVLSAVGKEDDKLIWPLRPQVQLPF